jgi:hypothetical protein
MVCFAPASKITACGDESSRAGPLNLASQFRFTSQS